MYGLKPGPFKTIAKATAKAKEEADSSRKGRSE
jgi:hypothetical protein